MISTELKNAKVIRSSRNGTARKDHSGKKAAAEPKTSLRYWAIAFQDPMCHLT